MASLRAPGLSGYLASRELAAKEQESELQQAGTVMGLQGALEQRRQKAKLQEILQASGGDPEKAIPALIAAGDVGTASQLAQMAEQKRKAALPRPGQPIGAGGLLHDDGRITAPAARPDTAPKAPITRNRIVGNEQVQEEMGPDGKWHEVGRGPRWQPPGPEKPAPLPKPKVGYRWNADGTEQERIPGGPVDVKFRADMANGKKAVDLVVQNIDRLDSAIGELEVDSGLSNITGPVMGRLPNVTSAATGAQAKLDSIKSQIFVQALQSMRAASPTGGAVGQVTEKEGDKLENSLAALQQAQGTPDFKNQLGKARRELKASKAAIQRAYTEQFGEAGIATSAGPAAPPASPSGPTEGQTATNPKTGQRIVFKGGKWQPM